MKIFNMSLWMVVFILVGACSGGSGGKSGDNNDDPTVPKLRGESVTIGNLEFTASSFSKFVKIAPDHKFILIEYGFFPEGTQIDNENSRLVFPCNESAEPENVNIQLSAPLERACVNPYQMAFTADGEAITVEGVVIPLNEEGVCQKFSEDFGFEIAANHVQNAISKEVISTDAGTLASFYQKVQ